MPPTDATATHRVLLMILRNRAYSPNINVIVVMVYCTLSRSLSGLDQSMEQVMSETPTPVPASKPKPPFNNLTPKQQKAVWIILPIALFAAWFLNSNSGTTTAGAAAGSTAAVSPAPTTAVNASAGTHEALVSRCVDAALDEGYGKAQCAEAFIDICVEKQSKSEMAQMAALSRSYGPMHMNGGMCDDNRVAKYGKEFDQKLAARDKF